MNTYEAMFLIDDKLDEKSAEGVLEQAKEMITKEGGEIISSRLWTDKRKLTFPIKKKEEARYYLVNF
ncbi:MAG: 30S ribosomal protein S6, partial [Candidatus Omnitrophica bacterium]|nr:30S ribosomal protein S6 [Candidatus Omnitrophota bacterium]